MLCRVIDMKYREISAMTAFVLSLAAADLTAADAGFTGTFFVPGVGRDTVAYDSDKTSGDSQMCWAHAFGCMVAWYQDQLASTGVQIASTELRDPAAIVRQLLSSGGNVSGSFSKGVSDYVNAGYMLSYIDPTDWNPMRPKAYTGFDRTNLEETFSTADGFSRLLLENLCKGVAFVDLYLPGSVGGHAVALWGARFEDGIVKEVFISDSDDGASGFTGYPVVCENGWIRLSGHWAPRVHALTFLWVPEGVEVTVPANPASTSADLVFPDGTRVSVAIPHASAWMQTYLARYPDDYSERLTRDSDGDGFSDVAEYVIGTDPSDGSSHLRITDISFDADGRPRITHEPVSNDGVAVFTVQGAPSPTGPWKAHARSDTAHRFFRVVASPGP